MRPVLPLMLWLGVVAISLSSRYHAVVDSGRPGEGPPIERPWAASFLGGLVPPSTAALAAGCAHGLSRVETSLSLGNLAAATATIGFYSPMTIRVTCAAAPHGPGMGETATTGCVVAAPPGEAVVLPAQAEAHFRFAMEPGRAWAWAADRNQEEGTREYAWEVEVQNGAETFSVGYSRWYFSAQKPGRGSLAALVERGQASVWERMHPPADPGLAEPAAAWGTHVSADLRAEVFARGDTVHVLVRDPHTFRRLFSSQPQWVTMLRVVAGEDRRTRVPVSYVAQPGCARQVVGR